MKQYVLGIDGGTTKTHCALYDIEGNAVDFLKFGPTNHEGLAGSFDELREKLKEILFTIASRNKIGIDNIVKSVFGLSGADTKSQHVKISGMIKDLGLTDFILCNDSFLGVKAGSKKGHGIGVVNGTGCTVCGIDIRGKMLQVGGIDKITGEYGGGSFIGSRAAQEIYRYLFRCGEKTVMKDMVFKELEINSKYDFIDALCDGIERGEIKLKNFAKVVFEAANQGDKAALSILGEMGSEVAASVNGTIRELEFNAGQPVDIVLIGSINIKGENTTALDRMKSDIICANPGRDIRFISFDRPPVSGAVIWALQEARQSNDLYEKAIKEISVWEKMEFC